MSLENYRTDDLKSVYRVLHAQLPESMELMDSDLLHDLQKLLQEKAKADGVDVSMHADWSAWLNGLS